MIKNWFKNLRLFKKLFLGFGLLLLILGIQQYISFVGMNELNDIAKELYEIKIQSMLGVNSIINNLQTVRIETFKYLGTKDPKEMDLVKASVLKTIEKIRKSLSNKNFYSFDTEKDIKAFEIVCKTFEKSVADYEKIISLHYDFMTKQALELINGGSQKDFESMTALLKGILEDKNKTAADCYMSAITYKDDSIAFQLIFCIAGMLAGVGFLFAVICYVCRKISRLSEAADRISIGDIDVNFDGLESKDEIGMLSASMSRMAENIKAQAAAAEKIARGDFMAELTPKSEKDIQAKSMNLVAATLKNLAGEIKELAGALLSGDLDKRGAEEKFAGGYRQIVNGFNETLDVVIKPLVQNILKILDTAREYSVGNFEVTLEKLPGKLAIANETMDNVRGNLQNLVEEMTVLAKSAIDGKLEVRGDITKFKGGYREIVAGVNDTLEAVITPIRSVSECLEKIAGGDLNVEVEGDYKGDHAILKNSLNKTISSINDILSHVASVVEQVDSGSKQVSNASSALSSAASDQASALEEISASMQEINSRAAQNADHASQANSLAAVARKSAETGNSKMRGMLSSMNDISDAATNISKIIKTIDEIAFQTNLLALNAAVEAARAGKHGKGFTVVAEEVRNLAQRSAKAARETADMIDASLTKTREGSKIAAETSRSLEEISGGVTRVSDLISEIAAASKEQKTGITQVNQGLAQVDSVTQQNTATAQESAAASMELSMRAEELKTVIAKFKLRDPKKAVDAYISGMAEENSPVKTLKALNHKN